MIIHSNYLKWRPGEGNPPPKEVKQKNTVDHLRYQSVDRLQQLLVLHEIQVPGEKNRGAVIFFGGD